MSNRQWNFFFGEWGAIAATLVLVIGVGAALRWTMSLDEKTERLPASVVTVSPIDRITAQPLRSDRHMAVLDINCADHGERPQLQTKSAHVRILTRGCEVVSVSNQTNGFEATVFPLGKNRVTTDHVSLAPGLNQIVIQSKDSPGPISLSVAYQ
jgi:hypothetical protein